MYFGWGALLLIHAIGIPLVYGLGKACGAKEGKQEIREKPEPS